MNINTYLGTFVAISPSLASAVTFGSCDVSPLSISFVEHPVIKANTPATDKITLNHFLNIISPSTCLLLICIVHQQPHFNHY